MDLACALLPALVLCCDPLAQQYADAAAAVPPGHWQLVRRVLILPADADHGTATSDGTIELPPIRRVIVLHHEVGHLIGWVGESERLRQWEAVAWSDGRPRWRLPSRYAGTNAQEDFAESYAFFLEGWLGECCEQRALLLREMLPELERYEGAGRR
jgi:hypothetical protein